MTCTLLVRACLGAAMLAHAALATAQAKEAVCYSPSEARGLVGYMAGPVIKTAAQLCGEHLGPSALLRSAAFSDVEQRYLAYGEREWPNARARMVKMMADDTSQAASLIDGMKGDSLRDLLNVGFAQSVAKDIKPSDCPAIDDLVRSLASVPPEAAVGLVTALFAFDKSGPFPLCESR